MQLAAHSQAVSLPFRRLHAPFRRFSSPLCFRSVIKLKSQHYGAHLHSHKVNYGSGSGQQSVTGFGEGEDNNDYWLVQSFDASTKVGFAYGKCSHAE